MANSKTIEEVARELYYLIVEVDEDEDIAEDVEAVLAKLQACQPIGAELYGVAPLLIHNALNLGSTKVLDAFWALGWPYECLNSEGEGLIALTIDDYFQLAIEWPEDPVAAEELAFLEYLLNAPNVCLLEESYVEKVMLWVNTYLDGDLISNRFRKIFFESQWYRMNASERHEYLEKGFGILKLPLHSLPFSFLKGDR